MKFKGDFLEGEVFVVASSLLGAVEQVDGGFIITNEDDANNRASENWPDEVYRVEVKIYRA